MPDFSLQALGPSLLLGERSGGPRLREQRAGWLPFMGRMLCTEETGFGALGLQMCERTGWLLGGEGKLSFQRHSRW